MESKNPVSPKPTEVTNPVTTTRGRLLRVGIVGALGAFFGLRKPEVVSGAGPATGQRESPQPLTPEQEARFIEDFVTITQTVKDYIRPEAIQNNPDINFEALLEDKPALENYRLNGLLGRAEYPGMPGAEVREGERLLWFYPKGRGGAAGIIIRLGSKGEKSGTLRFCLDENGKVTESPKLGERTMLAEQAQKVTEGFYKLPAAVKPEWTLDNGFEDNKQYQMKPIIENNIDYYLSIRQDGNTTFDFNNPVNWTIPKK